jgi:hypothetical protein
MALATIPLPVPVSEDKNSRVCRGHLPHPEQDIVEGFAASDDFPEALSLPEFLAQADVLLFKPLFELLNFLQLLLKLLVSAFPGEDIGEYLRDQLKLLHDPLRPVSLITCNNEG